MQGRAGLPTAAMLARLHEAVADIEQLKTELLSTGRPSKPPSAMVKKKKRKAHSMIVANGLCYGQGQSSKPKVYTPVLGASYRAALGNNTAFAFHLC